MLGHMQPPRDWIPCHAVECMPGGGTGGAARLRLSARTNARPSAGISTFSSARAASFDAAAAGLPTDQGRG